MARDALQRRDGMENYKACKLGSLNVQLLSDVHLRLEDIYKTVAVSAHQSEEA